MMNDNLFPIIKHLPPLLCVKNKKLENSELYDYELYLIEFLNASKFFKKICNGRFEHVTEQSHGEPDATVDTSDGPYSIDFKIADSKSFLQAQAILTWQIVEIERGMYIRQPPKKANSEIDVTLIWAVLSKLSVDDFKRVRGGERICESTNKSRHNEDVLEWIDMMETEKNLLLFFPYSIDLDIEEAQSRAGKLFKSIIQYRYDYLSMIHEKEYNHYLLSKPFDTFFATIVGHNFVLFSFSEEGEISYLDSVPYVRSSIFTHMLRLSSF